MQAKLPDINAALVKYRSTFINAASMGAFPEAYSCIENMIALLPKDYKIEINTEKYNTAIKTKMVAVCDDCGKEVPKENLKTVTIILNPVESLMSNKHNVSAWICSNCDHENLLESTRWIKDIIEQPYYLKVVPEPPRRTQGLEDKMLYKQTMKAWLYDTMKEIEYQIGLYRTDYQAQEQLLSLDLPTEDEEKID